MKSTSVTVINAGIPPFLLFINFSSYLTLVPPTLLCSENQDPEALHNVKLYYGGDGEYLFRLMICPEIKHFL